MEKLILMLLFPLLSLANASFIFTKDLYYSVSDSEVKELQSFLAEEKIYSGPITGNFYSLTLNAVKAFQAQERIFPMLGYFGPKTRTRINDIINGRLVAKLEEGKLATPDSVAEPKIRGCADSAAINYNPSAGEDDGSCRYSDLKLSNYNMGEGNVNEYYKIEAAGESFDMEEFIFLQNKTFRTIQFTFFNKDSSPTGEYKEWPFAGIQCGEYDNPVVPQKCSEDIGYKFYISKELGGQKSELTIPKDGYVLIQAITKKSSDLGRDVIKIISIKFKGQESGKIISVP